VKMKRLLVIDALNAFIRHYVVNPSLSSNGQPIGGVKGFLGSLNKHSKEIKPDKIIICWDGPGGSQKRKAVNKNYKEGRSPIRLNRSIRNLSENEEVANKIWQQTRLFEYLNEMPIVQLVSEGIEADDVIAYIVQHPTYKGWKKIIVSSDKDFIQLIDEETILLRPVQKEVLNVDGVVEKYNIHPNNFALAKAICGDPSDNLMGVSRVGLTTAAKRLPFLSEEKTYMIEEVVEFCENVEKKLAAHKNIIESEPLIRENYKLMQLYSPSISFQTKHKINNVVNNFAPEFNKTKVRTMFVEDGMGEISLNPLFENYQRMVFDYNTKK